MVRGRALADEVEVQGRVLAEEVGVEGAKGVEEVTTLTSLSAFWTRRWTSLAESPSGASISRLESSTHVSSSSPVLMPHPRSSCLTALNGPRRRGRPVRRRNFPCCCCGGCFRGWGFFLKKPCIASYVIMAGLAEGLGDSGDLEGDLAGILAGVLAGGMEGVLGDSEGGLGGGLGGATQALDLLL